MPRRKPFSAKLRKAQIEEKRLASNDPTTHSDGVTSRKKTNKTTITKPRSNRPQRSEPSGDLTRLHSSFIALTSGYLDQTRDLAHSTVLHRPIPSSAAVFPVEVLERGTKRGGKGHEETQLTCPSRPRFRFGQTKKEVEKNEQGIFRIWLKNTEAVVRAWVESGGGQGVGDKIRYVEEGAHTEDLELEQQQQQREDGQWPRSPTWFETNLEVWRQLWRVTESSSILLLLLDSRCPPIHCPPSLRSYIQSLKPKKEVILMLTKCDLVDGSALEGWKAWIKAWWGEQVDVVCVMSYDLVYLKDHGRHRPDIPTQSLDELIEALEKAHGRLLRQRPRIRDDPVQLEQWTLGVRSHVDWALLRGGSTSNNSTRNDTHLGTLTVSQTDNSTATEPPLTIGLIGQPNVGKSSLLNALLGEQRVRASKTPGKTKHFQTMYWGEKMQVKLVDCPGLVCPSLVGLEIQALAGILPISQIPSFPACISYASTILPLEDIFRIPAPSNQVTNDEYVTKKTWREPKVIEAASEVVRWTPGEIMEGRALDRGFLTAKGGRPDGNRAANGMMRALADGRVRWGFWPPGGTVDGRGGKGIWLERRGGEDGKDAVEDGKSDEGEDEDEMSGRRGAGEEVEGEDSAEGSDESGDEEGSSEVQVDENEDEDGEEEDESQAAGGFFAALNLEGDESEDEEEEEELNQGVDILVKLNT